MNSRVDPQYQFGYLLFNAIVSRRVKRDNESAPIRRWGCEGGEVGGESLQGAEKSGWRGEKRDNSAWGTVKIQ